MKIISSVDKQVNFVIVVDFTAHFLLAADEFIEAELNQFALNNI